MNIRLQGQLHGVVQGVGFRPFVQRLARTLQIGGFVCNQSGHVVIEAEGEKKAIDQFTRRVVCESPATARIEAIQWNQRPPLGEQQFRIATSRNTEPPAIAVPGDLAVCSACEQETFSQKDRRFGYGFASCTSCGPRFSIHAQPPWDREHTTMNRFSICETCRAEYDAVDDRRCHAQTVCCPRCGPIPELVDMATQQRLASGDEAVTRAIEALQGGLIVALKSIGGFQLLVRADDSRTVTRLRARKRRPTKPMAVLVASMAQARNIVELDPTQQSALSHRYRPIVLCTKRSVCHIAAEVTNGAPRIGIMLPTTPLHAWITRHVPFPLVATSGNLHEEPICIDNNDAQARLRGVADLLLQHDRPIARRCDDSVVDIVNNRLRVLRMGRGFAPHTVSVNVADESFSILAVGGHLKVAPALLKSGQIFLWPHIGDLDTVLARKAFTEATNDIQRFFKVKATHIACDQHPDYGTTIWAEQDGRPIIGIQHHHAHVAACLAEWKHNEALGFAWDGFGYGEVSTTPSENLPSNVRLWGGEVLHVNPRRAKRTACWWPFPLPGGDAASRDGRRALAGMCAAVGIDLPQTRRFKHVVQSAPKTTSVGRMFDAVAALTGICAESRFEGEAALRLEAIAKPGAHPYPITIREQMLDWRPALHEMIREQHQPERVASRFHASLIHAIETYARNHGANTVALVGGCFQNKILLEGALAGLARRRIRAITPLHIPPGDGGLALGQALIAANQLGGTKCA